VYCYGVSIPGLKNKKDFAKKYPKKIIEFRELV
jgi:hypothetical protein